MKSTAIIGLIIGFSGTLMGLIFSEQEFVFFAILIMWVMLNSAAIDEIKDKLTQLTGGKGK